MVGSVAKLVGLADQKISQRGSLNSYALAQAEVCFWHLADIDSDAEYVRYWE
jgi:hypothetical protein